MLQALLALQCECSEGYFKAPLLTKTAANGNKTLCNSGILAASQIAAYHLYMQCIKKWKQNRKPKHLEKAYQRASYTSKTIQKMFYLKQKVSKVFTSARKTKLLLAISFPKFCFHILVSIWLLKAIRDSVVRGSLLCQANNCKNQNYAELRKTNHNCQQNYLPKEIWNDDEISWNCSSV